MVKLHGKRIFVVEDNIQNRIIVQLALSKTGALLEFDRWGTDTVSKLDDFAPIHLILLDLMFPNNLTGYSIFEQIRAQPRFASVPIVAVSAAEPAIAVPKCRQMGFAGFIAKPFDADLFPGYMETLLHGEHLWAYD